MRHAPRPLWPWLIFDVSQKNAVRRYVLYFTLLVLLTNGGYALSQLASGKDSLVSRPLLLGSVSAAVFALLVARKRLRQKSERRNYDERR